MRSRRVAVGLLALLAALAAAPAQAGRPCEERPLEAAAVSQGMSLAVATARALDASGADVVVLARAGQDLAKYGLRYSHFGFAYREAAPPADGLRADAPAARAAAHAVAWTDAAPRPAPARGVWRVLHKLNHCGTADAALYRQGLGEFFLDRPHRYEAAFVVLAPALQAQLLPLLRDNARAARLHEPRYNMVAYPWATRYQQSNQWALETLALAVAEGAPARAPTVPGATGSAARRQAQAWLQQQGYQPTVLRLGAFTRLGARATAANVAFDDHPNDKRFADRIETVTVDSVFDWLARAGLGATPVTVRAREDGPR